jgi:hypothetical protein
MGFLLAAYSIRNSIETKAENNRLEAKQYIPAIQNLTENTIDSGARSKTRDTSSVYGNIILYIRKSICMLNLYKMEKPNLVWIAFLSTVDRNVHLTFNPSPHPLSVIWYSNNSYIDDLGGCTSIFFQACRNLVKMKGIVLMLTVVVVIAILGVSQSSEEVEPKPTRGRCCVQCFSLCGCCVDPKRSFRKQTTLLHSVNFRLI